MARKIYCLKCAETRPRLTSDEELRGWRTRTVYISVKKPAGNRGITMIVEKGPTPTGCLAESTQTFTPMPDILCDSCCVVVTGQIAVAASYIPPEREMRDWEHEYGEVLPEETVKLYEKVKKS